MSNQKRDIPCKNCDWPYKGFHLCVDQSKMPTAHKARDPQMFQLSEEQLKQGQANSKKNNAELRAKKARRESQLDPRI